MSLGRTVVWQFLNVNAGQKISSRERKMPSGVPPKARDLHWLEVDRHIQLQPMSGLPLPGMGPHAGCESHLGSSQTPWLTEPWCPGSAKKLLVNWPWGCKGICVSFKRSRDASAGHHGSALTQM